jgi:hypothetical protein
MTEPKSMPAPLSPESSIPNARVFRFVSCSFDVASGEARLVYAFDQGPEMVETVRFPAAPYALDAARAAAVEQALRLLHLIAGVSYYKAAVPPEIRIESYAIDADTAAFLTEIYENGLGEFAYRNGLSLRGKIVFPYESPSSGPAGHLLPAGEGKAPSLRVGEGSMLPLPPGEGWGEGTAAKLRLKPHALVAIGGGKDSLVSIEALRNAGVKQTVAWIGPSALIKACAERTGLPTLNIARQLAPELFELNKQGALNGHIPVTAINSAILTLAALLHDADQIVFSNERSASYGSLIPGAGEVNHQWSKGWSFERDFAAHLKRRVAADLNYYSLLRPFSELAVAKRFAAIDRYDAFFSSCNRNFHVLGERPAQRWCGACPKCRFVFLALAVFMPKPRLVTIFGRNLLDEPEQAAGFDALIEYRDHKPFECVGEGKESRAALAALADSASWREDAIVARFARDIEPRLPADELALAPLLKAADDHHVPAALWRALLENFRA